jgi:hypothetical protein
VRIVAHGGAKNNSGSFGWVIATSKKFLWECSGIASGWFANSFRSEGVGQLALLVFLETYTTYHQLQDLPRPRPHYHATADPWNRIATDNQGLIARIKSGLAAKTVFAGATLSAEYGVVHEILEITKRLPFPLIWEHVKGHQDKYRKWYKLTWMETLNVGADYHATEGLATEGNPSTLVTLIPSSKLGLRIATTDITSHYATHLRKAATRPAMLKRVQKHYGWMESQFDMIDWAAHHGAIQKLRFTEKKFITKCIHQSLPMGKILHPTQSITCRSCQRHQESETHLYRCKARRTAMDEGFLQVTLPTFLEDNHTCPQLAHTLIDAIASDLHDSKFPTFRNRHGANETKFRVLHQTQAYVGWSQLFQGRLVQDWSRLQEEFLAANNATLKLDRRYYTGDIWTRKLISLLWVTMRAQWDSRNADRHGHTMAENHAIRHARLCQAITEQYQDAPAMLAADRVLLEEPIEQKLKQHPNR